MGSSASYLQETPFSSTVLPYVCPESVLVKRSFLYMNDRSLVKKIPPANRENSAVDVVQMALDVAALPELIVIRVRHQVYMSCPLFSATECIGTWDQYLPFYHRTAALQQPQLGQAHQPARRPRSSCCIMQSHAMQPAAARAAFCCIVHCNIA
jgi:hypothetical protein